MPLAKARTGDHAWTPPASGASALLQASLPGAGRRRTALEVAGNNAKFASLARTAAPRARTSPRRMVGQLGVSHRERFCLSTAGLRKVKLLACFFNFIVDRLARQHS